MWKAHVESISGAWGEVSVVVGTMLSNTANRISLAIFDKNIQDFPPFSYYRCLLLYTCIAFSLSLYGNRVEENMLC